MNLGDCCYIEIHLATEDNGENQSVVTNPSVGQTVSIDSEVDQLDSELVTTFVSGKQSELVWLVIENSFSYRRQQTRSKCCHYKSLFLFY